MKKHLLVLVSILVFILGVSLVAANIALPPNQPSINPPGPFISAEELEKVRILDNLHKDMQRRLVYCRSLGSEFARPCREKAVKDYNEAVRAIVHPPQIVPPNGNSPGQGNNNQPAPNENAKANANDNAAFPTDPKPKPTCLPKGTKCTFMQTSRVFLDQIYRNMFECITPDGTTYYQYDTVFTDGRETETALTKFIGESADKCIAYYANVDPQTCKILWYSKQNRCGTESTPVFSSSVSSTEASD